jgi:hypothetical protein
MSSYFLIRCLGFRLIMMFRWLIWALRSSYVIIGRGTECIQTFIALVSAIWD